MSQIHLLVLIHGMWGNPLHLAELQRIAGETHSKPTQGNVSLRMLIARSITETIYDGVDWGGESVAQEVVDHVAALEKEGDKVVRFSMTGYSLGGLIARYCIGVLQQRGFFENIEPINFNTIATPHCGLPSYNTLFSSISRRLGPKLMSRTGEQFYCVDKWSQSQKGRPLLVVMADPDRIFYQTMAKFKSLRIYANAVNDLTVPYVTSAIETTDPFVDEETNGIEMVMREDYPCIIKSYCLPDTPPTKAIKPLVLSPEWFKQSKSKPSKPALPPALQFPFPMNIIFYASLPILAPAVLTLIIIRLSLSSNASRARVRDLEKASKDGQTKRLLHIIAELEREIEESVVEAIENPEPKETSKEKKKASPMHPIISPTHIKIATWLNQLPIQKELAYFPDTLVRNSHSMIVCRDVEMKRFAIHKRGEPVVRHWADNLVLSAAQHRDSAVGSWLLGSTPPFAALPLPSNASNAQPSRTIFSSFSNLEPLPAFIVSQSERHLSLLHPSDLNSYGKFKAILLWSQLMGPTGSGKSSFIEALAAPSRGSQGPLGIAKDQLESVTQEVGIYEVQGAADCFGLCIYIVDTPGFADPKISELEVLKTLRNWRDNCNLNRPINFLYFHPITDIRMPSTKKICMEISKSFWGPYNFSSVVLVTSMWNRLKPEMRDKAEQRFKDISKTYWESCIQGGSTCAKFDNTHESALQVLSKTMELDSIVYRSPSLPKAQGYGTISKSGVLVVEDMLKDRVARLQQQIQALNEELNDPATRENQELIKILMDNRSSAMGILSRFTDDLNALKSPLHRLFYKCKHLLLSTNR
ncbi:hypothetical protein CVT24_012437 [Panaeolus cyanescens]|uniref:DUF676 domain-containing protein n=1 Tax=Panaeolus cyanescens TaxID=181874 RepID=A0A409YJ39_9AGAR|nr:hypothetical protein CVT24_012437 [Panaeolus cyanescens]